MLSWCTGRAASGVADQQIAAGVMWSAGDLPFGIAIALLLQRWLTEQGTAAGQPQVNSLGWD